MRCWLAVAGLYLAGTLGFLWPMTGQPGTHIWGDRFDAWTTLWLIQHLADRLLAGDFSAHTGLILYPTGYNLWSFGHIALQLIGGVLVALGLPLVATYNLLLIGGVWTSALAAHALSLSLTRDHRAALVGGVLFATSPYLYGEGAAGCIELVAAGLLPLYVLTLVRLVRQPGPRRMLQSAAVLAIIGPFNWYYTLFAGMTGLGFAAWQILEPRGRRAVPWMLAAMALAAALDAPLIQHARQETPTRPPISAASFSDDAIVRATAITNGRLPIEQLTEAGLLEVDGLQVFVNSTSIRALIRARFEVNPLRSTPGALVYIVALAGVLSAGRRTGGWLALAGAATVLTLGPYLNLDGDQHLPAWAATFPLPYRLAYEHIPFFSKAYRPYRIGVIALLALSVVGAMGLAALQVDRRLKTAAAVLLAGVGFSQPHWAGDRPATRPLADATIPALYDWLAEAPAGAVIEVPVQYQPITTHNARFQYYQVVHRRPMLNANQLIRRPDLLAFRDLVVGNGFLTTLLDLSRSRPPYRFSSADLDALREAGFAHLIVHRTVPVDPVNLAGDLDPADLLGQTAVDLLRTALGEPVYTDETGWVFALPDAPSTPTRWVFTGEDVIDLDLPVDVQTHGLPVVLHSGQSLPLYAGTGRKLSLWIQALPGSGPLAVDLETAAGTERIAVALVAESWRFTEVMLPDGAVTVSLVSPGEETASVALTRIQVGQ